MKKVLIGTLSLSLFVSPIFSETVSEAATVDYEKNINNEEFLGEDLKYKMHENFSKNVDRLELTLEDESVVADFNRETGTVIVDGEIVATITDVESGTIDELNEESVFNPDISLMNLGGYPEFNIGRHTGSGVLITKSRYEKKVNFAKGASAVAIAATLVGAFVTKKPNQKAAAVISAAASIYALLATQTTYMFQFKAYVDKYDSNLHQDTLYVYRPGKGGVFKLHNHYWTNVW